MTNPIREDRERRADESAFERGVGAPTRPPTQATDYIRVSRPDVDDVVYVPGENIPADVANAVRSADESAHDPHARVWTVQLPATTTKRSAS